MKKFLIGFFVALTLNFFVFPTGFAFLPPALNSKMILAGWGILVYVYRSIRTHRMEISRIVFFSGLLAALFSLWNLIAVTLAETYLMTYVTYIKSFFTWLLGAYGAVAVMKWATGKDDLPTLTRYLAIICVAQCILALVIDNVPPVSSFVDSIFRFGQSFYQQGGRLYGVACALDVAGVRFAPILLLIAHQIATNRKVGDKSLSITTYLVAFFIISVVGSMIARTTVVGTGLGLAYMAVANMAVGRGGYVSSRQVRIFIVSFIVIVFMVALAAYLYENNRIFYVNLRFGFESFFNWVETGEFRSASTDVLENMWRWPTNTRDWILGTGIVGVLKLGTDIGYCNFVLYSGLVGMSIYSIYFIYNHLCLNEKFDRFALTSLLLVATTFIVWIKVQTDIFFIDALLFCVAGDIKFYKR